MEELNTANDVSVTEQDGFDTLTIVDLRDGFSMAQVDEDGQMHNVVIGVKQARHLYTRLTEYLA